MKLSLFERFYSKFILVIITSFAITHCSYSQVTEFSKSYINITKGSTGGTAEPGNVLEIRATFVVRSGSFDSCAYYAIVPAGTDYVPNTLRLLTNEGKIYKHGTAEELAEDEQVRKLYLGRNFELRRKDYLHEEAKGGSTGYDQALID